MCKWKSKHATWCNMYTVIKWKSIGDHLYYIESMEMHKELRKAMKPGTNLWLYQERWWQHACWFSSKMRTSWIIVSSLLVTCLNFHKAKELHSSACSETLGLYTESTVKQFLVTGTELSTPANSERPSDNVWASVTRENSNQTWQWEIPYIKWWC